MTQQSSAIIGQLLHVDPPTHCEPIQSLWSGYGAIERWLWPDGRRVILKRIAPPTEVRHPRGWHTDVGHQRKLESYLVEQRWYRRFSPVDAVWPRCLGITSLDNTTYLLLSDLDSEGFDQRFDTPGPAQIDHCIRWLAQFHARFIGDKGTGLWARGGYWHLDTRQEEWQRMENASLKAAASDIDRTLKGARWQTLVHGDAKAANFCFGEASVAAVDFQYVGRGAGVVDLAYFLGSVFDGPELQEQTDYWLNRYFELLADFLTLPEPSSKQLEQEWRRLYPVAVADFARFLDGWAPAHWKVNEYSLAVVEQVLSQRDFFLRF
ncbi:phosphotransferase [Ferrimonas balearica]|uniref:phosphotransferase n=1 Tax=Ferrimonas balearica TaxID=44012 RepID=UPI001C992816|nr:phosphotransferase [Ferrimonas balearica]MBY5920383.1 phosphotransferase [Ferrimonas balearica]MBY5996932.1 phosphotransferase [Ferrimonas balearica]